MNPQFGRVLRWALTVVIAAFLVVFARTIDWSAAWSSIRTASLPLLAAAVLLNFISVAVKGVRWWLFLKPAGAPSLGLSMRATIAGSGLNNILLANGGDAARVVFVSRATGLKSSTVLATLALERLFDPVGFIILLVYGVVLFPLPASLEQWELVAEIGLVFIFAFLIWFVHTSRNATQAEIEAADTDEGSFGKLKRYLAGFAASTRTLTTGPRFAGALVISMFAWALQVATFHFAAAAAHVAIPIAGNIGGLLATNLGLLVRATPGNVGFFQFVYTLAVAPFGVTRNDAIAVSLLIQTIQILPVTLIGIALAPEFIFGSGRRQARRLAHESEPVLLGALPKKGEELEAVTGEP